jgi:hypothetical protein
MVSNKMSAAVRAILPRFNQQRVKTTCQTPILTHITLSD